MPFLVNALNGEGKEQARKFLSDVFTGFLLLLVVVSFGVFICMPFIAHLLAPGFSTSELHMLVGTSRIMLLSPIFMGLSNMLGTVTQLARKFFIFSLSPIFYNVGIIIGIIFFYPTFGVYGLGAGVALGALLHLCVQLPTIAKAGFIPKISFRFSRKTLKNVAMLSLPRTLGLSMNSFAFLVIVALGSTLTVGSISIFNFAFNLETVPVMIVGISYAVATFPFLSETFAKGEIQRWTSCILSAIRQIIFWSLPLATLLIVLRAQIVRVVLGSGAFTWEHTRLTAAVLALFAISIFAQNMILVTVRGFYSAQNTKTPLIINCICSTLIIILTFLFVHLFRSVPLFRYFMESLLRIEDTPGAVVIMLPLAYSLGVILNAWLHWSHLRKRYLTAPSGLSRTFFESLSASFGIGFVSYALLNLLAPHFSMHTTLGVLMQGTLAGLGGVCAGIGILYALGSEPFFDLVSALRHKFWKVDLGVVESDGGSN
jgi:putative peptidoglycan lipid II flippase